VRSTPDTFPNVPITRPLRARALFARQTSSRSASATLPMALLLRDVSRSRIASSRFMRVGKSAFAFATPPKPSCSSR